MWQAKSQLVAYDVVEMLTQNLNLASLVGRNRKKNQLHQENIDLQSCSHTVAFYLPHMEYEGSILLQIFTF
jgi:hypothetical protein